MSNTAEGSDIVLSCSSCIETMKILCGQLNAWVYNLPTFRLDALRMTRASSQNISKLYTRGLSPQRIFVVSVLQTEWSDPIYEMRLAL